MIRSTCPRSALTVPVLLLTACTGGDSRPSSGDWTARTDSIGDTIVIRTISGSDRGTATLVPQLRIGALDGADHEQFGRISGIAVDREGTIYVYDAQVPALRRFAPDGDFLGNLGREGSGPGEYRNSDGGLAVLAEGRVLLRDPGHGRFTIYGAGGDFEESWPGPEGRFSPSSPVIPAADGGIYNSEFDARGSFLVRYSPAGVPVDTLFPPQRGVEMAQVSATREQSISQTWRVPFSASALSRFHPAGYFLSAVSDRYTIDLHRTGGSVLRIEREAAAVPVTSEERAAEEDRVTQAMRGVDPAWRWNGPPIPRTKPILSGLFAGIDGQIWAQLHGPGEPVPADQLEPGRDGTVLPRFREPIVFDVFEIDGRYLGPVRAPTELSTSPTPVFGADHVWAVARDELGVQYVVQYRIEWESEGATQ
jgi:hypothetical protein